jgi:hypothetical protein
MWPRRLSSDDKGGTTHDSTHNSDDPHIFDVSVSCVISVGRLRHVGMRFAILRFIANGLGCLTSICVIATPTSIWRLDGSTPRSRIDPRTAAMEAEQPNRLSDPVSFAGLPASDTAGDRPGVAHPAQRRVGPGGFLAEPQRASCWISKRRHSQMYPPRMSSFRRMRNLAVAEREFMGSSRLAGHGPKYAFDMH